MKSTKVQTLSGNHVYIARYASVDPNFLWGIFFGNQKHKIIKSHHQGRDGREEPGAGIASP